MRQRISILGSTGSVGTQALDVAYGLGLEVVALAASSNVRLLEEQARKFRPELVAVYDEDAALRLKSALSDTDTRVRSGLEGILECAAINCDMVLSAIVGLSGLKPALTALAAGNALALANKESLVCGGHLLTRLSQEKKVPIIPVDSEHSAIFQCLAGNRMRPAERLILTASGGPFFGCTKEQLENVTLKDALKHPTWSMGKKITVDSATLMNKGLELIEAMWLFAMPPEKIDIIVHRESIIHSMVEFHDGAVLAQLGSPDMKLPIQLAFTWPERLAIAGAMRLDFAELRNLSFFKPDEDVFDALRLARRAAMTHNAVVFNGANEAAVNLFLREKIKFSEITVLVAEAMGCVRGREEPSVEEIFELDQLAREAVGALQM